MLRLLVSLRRVKTNPRQLRVRYANVYLKQWDLLYQSKTSTQLIESRQETPAMADRGQSYVDSLGGCQKIILWIREEMQVELTRLLLVSPKMFQFLLLEFLTI